MATVFAREQTLEVECTIPANAPAGTRVICNITVNPVTGTKQAEVTIPINQEWYITDVFIKATGDVPVESQATFVKNGSRPLVTTPPLSAMLVSNPSRPTLPAALYYGPAERLSVELTTLAAETSGTSQTVKFYMKVLIYEYYG